MWTLEVLALNRGYKLITLPNGQYELYINEWICIKGSEKFIRERLEVIEK